MKTTEKVKSTAVWRLQYDDKTQVLEVQMMFDPPKSNGEILRYSGVPYDTYLRFRDAESKGQFFNEYIRGVYPFQGG